MTSKFEEVYNRVMKESKDIPKGLKKWVAEYIVARDYGNTKQAKEIKQKIDDMIEKEGLDKDEVYSVFGDPDDPKSDAVEKAKEFASIKEQSEDDEPSEFDAFIADVGRRGWEVSVDQESLGQFGDQDEAEDALADELKDSNYYPEVWQVSDHGNYINISKRFYDEHDIL